MPTKSDAEDLAKRAKFVFKGTILKLNDSTVKGLTTNARTGIVSVDEIVHAPTAFCNYEGKKITVQIGGRKKVKQGQQAVFFANGWYFGENIAVRSIDHLDPGDVSPQPGPPVAAAAATHGLSTPRPSAAEKLANRELQQNVESADTVVTGRVVAVRGTPEMLKGTASATAAPSAGVAAPAPQRFSEHDPLWCEAVVEVTGQEKGGGTPRQIVVRFPSSHDVRWHRVPKFTPGQEGVFILSKAEEGAGAAARPRAAGKPIKAAPEIYAVHHSSDFQPMHRVENVRAFISAAEKPAAIKALAKKSAARRRAK